MENQNIPPTPGEVIPPPTQPSPVNTVTIVSVLKKKFWMIIVLAVIFLIAIFVYFISLNNKNMIQETSVDLCSTYFGVCMNNADDKWQITVDTRQDFDLSNVGEEISVAFAYSTDIEFKETDPGFVAVKLLGETKQVYKGVTNGLTQVITGVKYNNANLIIIIASDKDITAEKVTEIIGKIKIPKI